MKTDDLGKQSDLPSPAQNVLSKVNRAKYSVKEGAELLVSNCQKISEHQIMPFLNRPSSKKRWSHLTSPAP